MAELTCGNTERIESRAQARAALQTNTPMFFVRSAPPGLTIDEVASDIEEACARWTNEGVNVTIIRVTDLAQVGPNDVVNFIETYPHPPGVVADQTLGNGFTKQHRMRLSTRFDWRDRDLSLAALTHELGHFWGLSHFPDGEPEELMEARLKRVRYPQPTEVAVAKDWFKQFPPIPTPTPSPDPTPTPDPTPKPPCCFRFKQDVLIARIPMNLTPEQQQALAKLDCAALLKGLLDRFLAGAIASLCPQAAQQANQEKPS